MKAAVLFTKSGPILILTSCASFREPGLLRELAAKHITKFIAYEVDLVTVQEVYGLKYDIVRGDLLQTDILRVLDFDGHNIFNRFALDELGDPVPVETGQLEARV
jgi:hypothetical protein